MYFKDVITELTESFMTKKQRTCPNCGKALLKKNGVLDHYIQVASIKFIGGICDAIGGCGAGSSVPAPDYYFKCPVCKSVYVLVGGKFIPIVKRGGEDESIASFYAPEQCFFCVA